MRATSRVGDVRLGTAHTGGVPSVAVNGPRQSHDSSSASGARVDPSSPLGQLASAASLDIASADRDRDIVTAVLEDLFDVSIRTDHDVAEVSDYLRRRQPVDDVYVAWDGRLGAIEVTGRLDGAVLVDENGTSIAATISGATLHFAEPLSYGMHTLSVGVDGRESLSTVISAPRTLPLPDPGLWGVFASTFALRGSEDLGVGDFSALRELADAVHQLGGDFVATLPVLPVYLDAPIDISPFTPISRTAWNELHVDLSLAPGAEAIADVVIDTPATTPRLVDYPQVARQLRASLATYARVVRDHPALRGELDRFLVSNPDIARYARFRSLGETLSRDWRRWPAPWRYGDLSSAPVDADIELMHQVGQWLAFRQMDELIGEVRDRGQRLQLELPVASHPNGFDVWREQRLHMSRTRVHEPPDGSAPGLAWGHLGVRPDRDRRRGHRAFGAAVRHHAQGGFLRIDQISALWRSWLVPDGADISAGVYLHQPAEEFLAIVCLECHRTNAIVVAGNLSSAPAEIREVMLGHGAMQPLLDGRRAARSNDERISGNDLPNVVHRSGDAALVHLDDLLAEFGPTPLDEDASHQWRVRHPRGVTAALDDDRLRSWFDDFIASWDTP
jgi:hypothetical protein